MFNPIQKLLNTKFRNKLFFMCIAAIVPITLAGVFLLYNVIDLLRSNAANEALFEANGLKARLKDTIATVTNISDRIYEASYIQDIMKNDFVNEDEYYTYYLQSSAVSEYPEVYPQVESVKFYIDMDGFVYNNTFEKASETVYDTYWYKEAAQQKNKKWQVILTDSGDYRLALVYPLEDRSGDFCGTMVVSVSPEWLDELVKEKNSGVVFSIAQGIVFYSTAEGCSPGMVVTTEDYTFPVGISDSQELNEGKSTLEKNGYPVVSYFDYENTGNLFQVFIVKSSSLFSDISKNVIFMYIWYVAMCIILSVLLTILFSSVFSGRIKFLKEQMHSVAEGNFELTEDIKGTDEIYDLYEDLKKMVDSMQALINDAYKAKIQSESFKLNQVEAEFKALASQINPHFLYNTLETIRMKAYCNNDKETADLVKKLGKFMRRCLEVKDGMVTLESELEFTKSYLELQSARFGDRVSYSIYCEVEKHYMVLPLIIQPIVENAFVHGIESSKSNGRISVKIFYRGENVVIEVADNGQGITPERLEELLEKLKKNDTSSGKSIGLTNVNKRIKMYHGESYGLSVETIPGKGTVIRITLPRVVDENVMKRLPEKYGEISGNISAKLGS
ncbi:MAG: sensor histidine kinase [Oscillospiraceae bacterium]|nr:sensor histidine kinase [Oscillospiraceae bacterium]